VKRERHRAALFGGGGGIGLYKKKLPDFLQV
jgi:hypothetical protein